MDYSIILLQKVSNCSFCILRVGRLKLDVFLSLKIVSFFANSADVGEMPPFVAFQLGLHCCQSTCLPCTGILKFSFNGYD